METWHEVAQENQEAANRLLKLRLYRSMVSRAYYAVYAKATHGLLAAPVPPNMPEGREGPSHSKLRPMIENKLRSVSPELARAVSGIVRELYILRVSADYRPSDSVDALAARKALVLMRKAWNLLP